MRVARDPVQLLRHLLRILWHLIPLALLGSLPFACGVRGARGRGGFGLVGRGRVEGGVCARGRGSRQSSRRGP